MKYLFTGLLFFFYLQNFAQEGRSIGRKYSKKLMDQEKYFDQLKKSNGEVYGQKELSVEAKIERLIKVVINNTSRNIEIKTWDEPKVKIFANIYFDGKETNLGNEFWLEKLKVKTRLWGNKYLINIDGLPNEKNDKINNEESIEIYSIDGEVIKKEKINKRQLIIYVPKNNKVEIESKYSDVIVSNYINEIKVNITNGNYEMQEAKVANIDSKYANVNISKIDSVNITFINGDLTIENANCFVAETKYSNILLGNINYLTHSSTNDEVEIEQVKQITTTKNYGNLNIKNISEGISVEGINAPIQIENIQSTVKFISIDNKYANIKLPVNNCKNFTFNYKGTYSTIQNNFTNSKTIKTEGDNNDEFKASLGRGEVPIGIKCINCSIDMR